jgi:hypothetical protein
MKKFLVMLSFGAMLLASPALSHAAFVNYSGVTTKATAKVVDLNLSGAFQTSTLAASVPARTKNTAVSIDTSTGQISGNSYFPGGAIQLEIIGPPYMVKKGNGFIGNIVVISTFYSGTVTYDPSSDTYSGDGKLITSEAGAKVMFVPTSATAAVLKIQNVSPISTFSQDVAAGTVNSTQNPLVMKSLIITPFKLVVHP